jgi:glucan phosphoethanolaminetransferase (alkaline phosphatase superfamily)
MNEEILICYLLICSFLVLRVKYYGFIQFAHILLSIFLLISMGSVIFLVYDTWLSEKLSKDEIESVFDKTYKDIDNITTVVKNTTVTEPSFPQDKKDDKENKKLVRNSLLIGLIPLVCILYVLRRYDPNFYVNVYKNLFSITILYIVELYFSWAITSDFKGEGLEKIRHEIISKLRN